MENRIPEEEIEEMREDGMDDEELEQYIQFQSDWEYLTESVNDIWENTLELGLEERLK